MTNIFIDTDIILDFLGKRKLFAKHAADIFIKAEQKQIKLYTSSNSITTAYYLLSKLTGEGIARQLIIDLLNYISIIPVSERILQQALKSEFKDFEDAVQHYCAITNENIKFIITRNLKDFKKRQLPLIGPEQLDSKI